MLRQIKQEYNQTNNASAVTHMWDTLQVKVCDNLYTFPALMYSISVLKLLEY